MLFFILFTKIHIQEEHCKIMVSNFYQNLHSNVKEQQNIKHTTVIFCVEDGSKLSAAHS